MSKQILILLFLFLGNISFSQSFDVEKQNLRISKPESNNFQAARDLHLALNSGLKKHFNVHNQSVFTLRSFVKVNESKSLEAMGTYTSADINLEFHLENGVTQDIKKWDFTSSGKGEDQRNAITNAFDNFQSDEHGMFKLTDSISIYIAEQLDSNCLSFIKMAENAVQVKDLPRALLILNNIKEGSGCASSKKPLEIKITEMQAEEFCDVPLKKINVMVESDTPYQLEKAMQELLMMPPGAACMEEARSISQKIKMQLKGEEKNIRDLIDQFNLTHSSNSWEMWFDYFLKKKLN